MIKVPFKWERSDGTIGAVGKIELPIDLENVKECLNHLFIYFNGMCNCLAEDIEFHNRGPSMSAGDIIHLAETSYECYPVGWEIVR